MQIKLIVVVVATHPLNNKKSGRIGVFVQPRSQGAFTSKARGKRPWDEVGRCRAVVDCVPEKLYNLSFFRLQFKKIFSGQHDSCTARTYPTLAWLKVGYRRKIYTPPPPQPKSRMAKWRALAFYRLHSWFRGGDGVLLSHFVLSRTEESLSSFFFIRRSWSRTVSWFPLVFV